MASLVARNSAKLAGAQRASARRSVAPRAAMGKGPSNGHAAGAYADAATPYDNYKFAPIREATVRAGCVL